MRPGRGIAAAVVLVTAGAAAFFGYRMLTTSDSAGEASPAPVIASASPSPSETVEPALAWGPTEAEWEQALADAGAMPLDRVAGQVLVPSWASTDASGAAALVTDLHVGGLIFMSDAFADTSQVAALTAEVQGAGAEDDRDWPVIVSLDQEGGSVARLANLIPDMPAFMASGSIQDKSRVTEAHRDLAADLAALGFNVDYAPVADVTIGMADPVIRARSAGSDPANVSATVTAAVEGLVDGGVVPAVKHFPGHGSVTSDSHSSLPVQSATVAQLAERDFVPFRDAIAAGAPVVMMGHIGVPEWGSGPATVTPASYAYLRDELGFTGVIATDALNMEAIAASYGPGDAAVAALAAGADLLLMPADPVAAHDAIVAAVNTGALPRERLDEAAARSILLMRWQASLEAAQPSDANHAADFIAHAATVASASCGGPFVGSSVRITGGFQGERDALAAALAQYGIATGSGTHVRLLGAPDGSDNADVVVAMDGPWGLPSSTATTYVGLYGRSDDAMAGLAAVLAGATPPGGQWPVDVTGIPFAVCS
jgi:beta-glucosidase-like glycosyl hydrolase